MFPCSIQSYSSRLCAYNIGLYIIRPDSWFSIFNNYTCIFMHIYHRGHPSLHISSYVYTHVYTRVTLGQELVWSTICHPLSIITRARTSENSPSMFTVVNQSKEIKPSWIPPLINSLTTKPCKPNFRNEHLQPNSHSCYFNSTKIPFYFSSHTNEILLLN